MDVVENIFERIEVDCITVFHNLKNCLLILDGDLTTIFDKEVTCESLVEESLKIITNIMYTTSIVNGTGFSFNDRVKKNKAD